MRNKELVATDNMESIDLNIESIVQKCYKPTICPICDSASQAKFIKEVITPIDLNKTLSVALFLLCPVCKEYYMASYHIDHFGYQIAYPSYLVPHKHKEIKFSPEITKVSSKFTKIFNESSEAEELGLLEIVAPGYRRSFEFLIRDYLIYKNHDEEETYQKTALANCIKDHIDDKRIKTSAEKAYWIGSDKTHYFEKYTDRDIKDVKNLIELTVHFIQMELLYEDAESIPHPTKS